jgi:uncharacterized membrane protein
LEVLVNVNLHQHYLCVKWNLTCIAVQILFALYLFKMHISIYKAYELLVLILKMVVVVIVMMVVAFGSSGKHTEVWNGNDRQYLIREPPDSCRWQASAL